MSHERTIGEVAVRSECDIEWKIDNIFSYKEINENYYSPNFTLCNCEWYFQIFPNGEEDCAGWISLYLHLSGPLSNQGATFNFGVKRCDGKVDKNPSNVSWIFVDGRGYGYSEFLRRSTLVQQKNELAPSDSLTVACTLLGYDDFDSTANTSSLSKSFLELFTSRKECDATLQVKHEKFSVHRCILMARSPVFEAMFETPMKERTTGVVDIEDSDPEAFRDFLVYLYSGRLKNLSRHMLELYTLADKYNVEDLKSDCLVALMGNLSVENIFDAVILADKFDENELKIKAGYFINNNYGEIFRRTDWETFSKREPLLANKVSKIMIHCTEEK